MEDSKISNGAYGMPYDFAPAIRKLSTSHEEAISELWENLYHQGDVGLASYFAVPTLVRAGELSLVATIEVARNSESNPKLPENFKEEYTRALNQALSTKPEDEENLLGYYVIHASIHGHKRLANALALMDLEGILNEYL